MPSNSCKATFNHSVLAVLLALFYAGISQQKDVKALKTACWALFILLMKAGYQDRIMKNVIL